MGIEIKVQHAASPSLEARFDTMEQAREWAMQNMCSVDVAYVFIRNLTEDSPKAEASRLPSK